MSGSVVAIGKFEGVHRGHQEILRRLLLKSKSDNLRAVILTFENNPLSVLRPEACPEPVMSPQQRKESFVSRGISEVVMLPFTRELSQVSPEEFIETYLVNQLDAKHVIVGDDFRFGRGATGSPETLRDTGVKLGFTVEIVEDVSDPVLGRISSSLIRTALGNGDVKLAATLLGHPHALRGQVVHGDARGRQLGFPTANLGAQPGSRIEGFVPAEGVYAGLAVVDGKQHAAAISVGNNPTFTPDAKPRVETFILDFDADIYGKTIEVRFVDRIRGNVKFDSVEELITQMHADIEKARQIVSAELSTKD